MTDTPASTPRPTASWKQLSLLGDEVVHIHLQIGVVPEADHLQWQLTVRNPAANTLLGMLSSPAVSAVQWPRQLELIVSALGQVYENHVAPF